MACGDYGFRTVNPAMHDPGIWLFSYLCLAREPGSKFYQEYNSLEVAVNLALQWKGVPADFKEKISFWDEYDVSKGKSISYGLSSPDVQDLVHQAMSADILEPRFERDSYHFCSHNLARLFTNDAPDWYEHFVALIDLHHEHITTKRRKEQFQEKERKVLV